MSAGLSLSEVITEALARPLKAECSWCHSIYRDGPVDANGLHSHGICPGCEERILTRRAQDRAYRLYLDVQSQWINNLDLAELLIPLLGFIQSGGGLGQDAADYVRFKYEISEAQ